MARDSVSWPDLVQILGREKALAFCAARGGLPTYIPKNPNVMLVAIIGECAAKSLCRMYAGNEIIPAMGESRAPSMKERALVLLESGMTELDAAMVLRCHIRTVQLAAQIMRRGRPKPKKVLAKNVGVYRLPICIAVEQA